MGDRLPVPARPPAPPTVLRAATSPPSLVLAAAAGAISLATGLPGAAVVIIVAICWAIATGVVLPWRRWRAATVTPEPDRDRPNPYAVPQPWRDLVSGVLRSQQKFQQVVADARPGPLRDRMSRLGDRLEEGVRECWTIAQRGVALNNAVARLDPAEIHRQKVLIEAQLAAPGHADAKALDDALTAVGAQMASVERLQAVAEDTRAQLQRLAARLGEAVAEAVELSVADPEPDDLHALTAGIDDVVGELEILARAVDEAGGATDNAATGSPDTGGNAAGGQPEPAG